MNFLRKCMSVMMITCLMVAAMPAMAMHCAHASVPAQTAAQQVAVEADDITEAPCPMHAAPQTTAAQDNNQDDTKTTQADCCGTFCTCALGNCHAGAAVLARVEMGTTVITSSTSAAPAAHFAPYAPEMSTPPPRV
jgi:hypothetical protein